MKDVRALEDNLPNNGVRLFVDFKRMGVTQKFAFICMIEAHLKVESHDGNILKERAISISEKGIMTLSAAKNKAIKKFIKELEGLLNEI